VERVERVEGESACVVLMDTTRGCIGGMSVDCSHRALHTSGCHEFG